MNARIKNLRNYILDKKHHSFRRSIEELEVTDMSNSFVKKDMPPVLRSAMCFSTLLSKEVPVILPGEKIVFTRTINEVPEIYTKEEWDKIKVAHYIHERGTVCNISPDYETTIKVGLAARKKEIEERLKDSDLDEEGTIFLNATHICLTSLQSLISKYEEHARYIGENDTADVLKTIQTNAASSFREALQILRILHFAIWEAGNYHNTFGRFDQYMYPYYKNDIEKGILTQEEAFDLLEEFFLTCNKDSDLYPGMQQGDNGQSMVLGGRNANGEYMFNELSRMCLKASYELELIDPKINIRVDKNTPEEIYELGSHLTKKGLGFPQYSNDDIVIPGLLRKGYENKDAYNYVVAACWEFIIPKYALDIPNIAGLSLILCVKECLDKLESCPDYESFYRLVEQQIQKRADEICEEHKNLYIIPAPMMSLLMEGTIERAKDISFGSKYNNYGIHGTGIATAADSLAAIKKYYFEEKRIDAKTLLDALQDNFEKEPELENLLRKEAPKMGQDDDYVDSICTTLLDSFDKALSNKKNERGGVYRAGTGTAMYYIFHANDLKATPDGRKAEEMIPANYSPTLFMQQKGPVSVIKSFTKPHLKNVINGGPLTLEFDQSVFNNNESVRKLGMLVRTFITLGGHQLQLNTVSREKLLDAKKHPENYKHLIVRVWGWSGYFVELDECYQDHVINRIEFGL
ncbi:pyruvate formate lyase family protein [Bacteroides sp.]|uniref:pyruvate formate lyase family protein n=1 Tax=Bacteroides sp. TaxID=29523 RepID=UPI0026327FD3|nr:pyruvate formate lyase family protein [Bacteroides sp.]MDD3036981.1 pyruvate formate lyase family protein [Bacteroides sp.]